MKVSLSRHASLMAAGAAAVGGLTILLSGSSAMPTTSAMVAASAVAVAAAETPKQRSANAPQDKSVKAPTTLTPEVAAWLTGLAHRTTDPAAADALFASHSWYVAPRPPPPAPVTVVAAAPTAPALPYTFVGSYQQGGQSVYFLVRNDRVYDAKPGDTLDGVYSFDSADKNQLVFTYKPLNIRQTLAVGSSP